jgi:hypothetical protein
MGRGRLVDAVADALADQRRVTLPLPATRLLTAALPV